jgi:hypothetical protein
VGSGSIFIPSTSYSEDAVFYLLFHIVQGVLVCKAVTVIKLLLEVIVIPNEDQLLLPFPYVWFSIGAKMNLCGPGKLKVIWVVVGGNGGKLLWVT